MSDSVDLETIYVFDDPQGYDVAVAKWIAGTARLDFHSRGDAGDRAHELAEKGTVEAHHIDALRAADRPLENVSFECAVFEGEWIDCRGLEFVDASFKSVGLRATSVQFDNSTFGGSSTTFGFDFGDCYTSFVGCRFKAGMDVRYADLRTGNVDFSNAVFDSIVIGECEFGVGTVLFRDAEFNGPLRIGICGAQGDIDFAGARFRQGFHCEVSTLGTNLSFEGAHVENGIIVIEMIAGRYHGEVKQPPPQGTVTFANAVIESAEAMEIMYMESHGSVTDFRGTVFRAPSFTMAGLFTNATFEGARFECENVDLSRVWFDGETPDLDDADFGNAQVLYPEVEPEPTPHVNDTTTPDAGAADDGEPLAAVVRYLWKRAPFVLRALRRR